MSPSPLNVPARWISSARPPNPAARILEAAVLAGARLSTHLGNGAHALLPRHANYIQMQMADDRLMASMICDGHHLPAYFFKNALRAKGRTRVILVTDATAAAAAPPGKYTLGSLRIEAGDDGMVKLPGTPYLVGSSATMDMAISNASKFAGIPLSTAIRMGTVNPARLFRNFACALSPGERADLVIFNLDQDSPPGAPRRSPIGEADGDAGEAGGMIKIEKVFLEGEPVFHSCR